MVKFEKLLSILPRNTLEALCRDYASEERPHVHDRATLIKLCLASDCQELRDDVAEVMLAACGFSKKQIYAALNAAA